MSRDTVFPEFLDQVDCDVTFEIPRLGRGICPGGNPADDTFFFHTHDPELRVFLRIQLINEKVEALQAGRQYG